MAAAPVTRGSGYPAPCAAAFAERVRMRRDDAAGLRAFGVNLLTLPPGVRSSLRRWHEVGDEMVVVLEGEVVLIEEDGDTVLGLGEAAGFPGGVANAHAIEKWSDRPARLLEIRNRPAADRRHYADVDLVCHDHDGESRLTRRDGSPA